MKKMATYFDIMKLVFFILTIIVSLFEMRIKWIISSNILWYIWPFVMPIYLIFVWIIIWYIIWYILVKKNDQENEDKMYIKWFIIWWIIWLLLSAVYYFM